MEGNISRAIIANSSTFVFALYVLVFRKWWLLDVSYLIAGRIACYAVHELSHLLSAKSFGFRDIKSDIPAVLRQSIWCGDGDPYNGPHCQLSNPTQCSPFQRRAIEAAGLVSSLCIACTLGFITNTSTFLTPEMRLSLVPLCFASIEVLLGSICSDGLRLLDLEQVEGGEGEMDGTGHMCRGDDEKRGCVMDHVAEEVDGRNVAGANEDRVGKTAARVFDGRFRCGNFGVLLSRILLDHKDQSQALPSFVVCLIEEMARISMVRGGQAGGIVTYLQDSSHSQEVEGNKGQSESIEPNMRALRVRVLNGKRSELAQKLSAAVRHCLRLDSIKQSIRRPLSAKKCTRGSVIVSGHTRFATSSAPAEIETHPHQWSPPKHYVVWSLEGDRVESSKWTRRLRSVENFITHNGDFDRFSIFHQEHTYDKIGQWLAKVLNKTNDGRGDSVKIAGLIDLLHTKGMWFHSVRLAYHKNLAESLDTTLLKGSPSEEHLRQMAGVFESAMAELVVITQSASNEEEHDEDPLDKRLVDKVTDRLRSESARPLPFQRVSKRHFEDFIFSTVRVFFANDLYTAVRLFLNGARGSFGLVATSSIFDGVVVAAEGQPMSVGFDEERGICLFASEANALKVDVGTGGSVTKIFSLDEVFGEVLEVRVKGDNNDHQNHHFIHNFLSSPLDPSPLTPPPSRSLSRSIATSLHRMAQRAHISSSRTYPVPSPPNGDIEAVNDDATMTHPDSGDATRLALQSAKQSLTAQAPFSLVRVRKTTQFKNQSRSQPEWSIRGVAERLTEELGDGVPPDANSSKQERARSGVSVVQLRKTASISFSSYQPDWSIRAPAERASTIHGDVVPIPYIPRALNENAEQRIAASKARQRRVHGRSRTGFPTVCLSKTSIPLGEHIVLRLYQKKYDQERSLERAEAGNNKISSSVEGGTVMSRFVDTWENPYYQPVMVPNPKRDVVKQDLLDLSKSLFSVQCDWQNATSSNRISARAFSDFIIERISNDKQNGSSEAQSASFPKTRVDVLVTGLEASLWVGEQFASDLQKAFPVLKVVTISANKILEVFGSSQGQKTSIGFDMDRQVYDLSGAVALVISQSGNTFATMQATHLLVRITSNRTFVMVALPDALIAQAVGQELRPDAPVCPRVFINGAGWRPAEPYTVAITCTHQSLTELLLSTTTDVRQRFYTGMPGGLLLRSADVQALHQLSWLSVTQAVPRLTGSDIDGSPVHHPIHKSLRQQGRRWGMHVLESPLVWIVCAIYIFLSVFFGAPLFYGLGTLRSTVEIPFFLTWILHFFDALFYVWMPLLVTLALRLLQRRQLLARMGKRTIVIGDVPLVNQVIESYVSKLFALSYGIASVEVHGGNSLDHLVHRFTHRVSRGVLLAVGRPDGRLCAHTRAEGYVLLAIAQAKSIQNLGTGPEVVSLGCNPYQPRLVDKHLALPTVRPLFPCEVRCGLSHSADETLDPSEIHSKQITSRPHDGHHRHRGPQEPPTVKSSPPNPSTPSQSFSLSFSPTASLSKSHPTPRHVLPLPANTLSSTPHPKGLGVSPTRTRAQALWRTAIRRVTAVSKWRRKHGNKSFADVVLQVIRKQRGLREAMSGWPAEMFGEGSPFEVRGREAPMEDLYESRIASLERMIAFMVMFHAMASRVASFWPLNFDLSRSQSSLRVASTAAPVSGAEVAEVVAKLRVIEDQRASNLASEVGVDLSTNQNKDPTIHNNIRDAFLKAISTRSKMAPF